MFCPICGSWIDEDSYVCSGCGYEDPNKKAELSAKAPKPAESAPDVSTPSQNKQAANNYTPSQNNTYTPPQKTNTYTPPQNNNSGAGTFNVSESDIFPRTQSNNTYTPPVYTPTTYPFGIAWYNFIKYAIWADVIINLITAIASFNPYLFETFEYPPSSRFVFNFAFIISSVAMAIYGISVSKKLRLKKRGANESICSYYNCFAAKAIVFLIFLIFVTEDTVGMSVDFTLALTNFGMLIYSALPIFLSKRYFKKRTSMFVN